MNKSAKTVRPIMIGGVNFSAAGRAFTEPFKILKRRAKQALAQAVVTQISGPVRKPKAKLKGPVVTQTHGPRR